MCALSGMINDNMLVACFVGPSLGVGWEAVPRYCEVGWLVSYSTKHNTWKVNLPWRVPAGRCW